MCNTFDRYLACKKIVEEITDEEQKKHANSILSQLLHLEQGRQVAVRAYQNYCKEMNEWEWNLVKEIKRRAQEGN